MKFLRARWRALLLVTGLAAVAAHWLVTWIGPAADADETPYLASVFPEAYGYTAKAGAPPHYGAYTPDGEGRPSPVGVIFRTTEAAGVPRGYAGEVPVLVGLDGGGKITGVVLLEHHETPSYVAGIEAPEFLQQFVGKTVLDPLLLDEDIDGVTRATVTASAVTDGIRLAGREVAREVLDLEVPPEREEPFSPPWAVLASFAVLCAAAVMSLSGPARSLRWVCFLGGLALLGWWQGIYLSTTTAANILLWRWPAFREHLLWHVLAAFGIGAALLWRNVYCARMCPFGALQELLHRLVPWRLGAEEEEDREARQFRYVYLWLVTMAVFLFGRAEAANYEPFSTAFDFKGGTVRWLLLAAVLVLAALRHRFWCRYFCPTGLWLQLLGRMRSRNPFD